jgi:hypothetical protein
MNVLCLGSEVVGPELAADLIKAFLGAEFIGGGRYERRLEKVKEIERWESMPKSRLHQLRSWDRACGSTTSRVT